jgi:hypothetical protein
MTHETILDTTTMITLTTMDFLLPTTSYEPLVGYEYVLY